MNKSVAAGGAAAPTSMATVDEARLILADHFRDVFFISPVQTNLSRFNCSGVPAPSVPSVSVFAPSSSFAVPWSAWETKVQFAP